MDTNFISKVCDQLILAGIATPDQIRGCSLEDIRKIESSVKGQLPKSYVMFLLAMGHGAGSFFKGTDIFYPNLLENRRRAEELLDEINSSFKLLESDFVFAIHQGYQFMYFDVAELSSDPPVYYYMEGEDGPEKKWESFSKFMLKSAEDYQSLPSAPQSSHS
jgi:hypothetical protein